MIKFFRKIRQELLSEGKTGKYLKYAFGEIILVVIGILIALSISNWNEDRKDNSREIITLMNLKSELEISLGELKSDYNATKLFHNATLRIQNYILNNTPETDSLYKDFVLSYQFAEFFPKTSTYETLKNGNLELIQSDSLKIFITDIYEAGYKRILSKSNTIRDNTRYDYYIENFRIVINANSDDSIGELRESNYAIPNNYEFLIQDSKYESIISETVIKRRILLRDFEASLEAVENGISQIDEYLKQNSK